MLRRIKQGNQNGQALVLVLLSLAVVLTLVLYILSRSITDVSVSTKNQDSVRAFSAAEAGIEQALVAGSGASNIAIGSATYSSSVSNFAEGSSGFNYPIEMASQDINTTWFVAHDTNGDPLCDVTHPCFTGSQMQVCWGKPGTSASSSTTPAIEVSIFYESTPGSIATTQVARVAIDPNTSRQASNYFVSPDLGTCSIDGINYGFQKTIQFSSLGIPSASYNAQNGLQFAHIKMFYNTDTNQTLGINVNSVGNGVLPSQGQDVISTGTAGQSNRKVSVFQAWPEIPSVFDNVIYSSGGITK